VGVRAQAVEIRVGSTANDSYAEPFYAQDEGFFTRAGLNVSVERFSNGAGVTSAVAGNALDVGVTNPISLANAVEHGLPLAFFAVAALYNRNSLALCVAQDAPIHSAKDLEGKAVGVVALRDANSLEIVAWIDQNGGDSSKVRLVEIPFSEMPPAVRRGTIDAAPVGEPALSLALKEGGLRQLGHPADVFGKTFMIGGWFGHIDWLQANRPLVRRFVDAIYATARWANASPDESALILAKYAKMDPAVVRTMQREPYGDSFGPQLFESYLKLGYDYKYLGRPIRATELIVAV
jgi:NitT/TauT family transport system substrate-binding protein